MRRGDSRSKAWLTAPNILTALRIIGSMMLPFVRALSPLYYSIYTIAGVSDALDGIVARATHSTSELGARLDSVADILFYAIMGLTLLPILYVTLPEIIWLIVAVVLLLRITSYIVAALKYKCFASMHTWLNKLTGLMVFMTPYVMKCNFLIPYCFGICVVGGLASAEELLIHMVSSQYDPKRKSIFRLSSTQK